MEQMVIDNFSEITIDLNFKGEKNAVDTDRNDFSSGSDNVFNNNDNHIDDEKSKNEKRVEDEMLPEIGF